MFIVLLLTCFSVFTVQVLAHGDDNRDKEASKSMLRFWSLSCPAVQRDDQFLDETRHKNWRLAALNEDFWNDESSRKGHV